MTADRCGAPHDAADLNGIYCELPAGHTGEHEALIPITWPQDGAVGKIGADAPPDPGPLPRLEGDNIVKNWRYKGP